MHFYNFLEAASYRSYGRVETKHMRIIVVLVMVVVVSTSPGGPLVAWLAVGREGAFCALV